MAQTENAYYQQGIKVIYLELIQFWKNTQILTLEFQLQFSTF